MIIPEYSLIKTGDGTFSIYSNAYKQAMHSTSGAYQEALLKHVYPSNVLSSGNKELCILDIGFGIGYNVLALIIEFLREKTDRTLHIISLEKDISYKAIMDTILFNDERDKIYKNIKYCLSKGKTDHGQYSIEIIFGDARDSIKTLNDISFDTVFHDPYSPSRNPELWSVEFFTEVNKLMKDSAVLTTYSSAMQIRTALLEAGFRIGKGPSVGRKREGTLASRFGDLPELSKDDIHKIKSNIRSIPYRDYDLKDTREVILNRRIEIIKKMRKRHI